MFYLLVGPIVRVIWAEKGAYIEQHDRLAIGILSIKNS
jgi:hypothetical protein